MPNFYKKKIIKYFLLKNKRLKYNNIKNNLLIKYFNQQNLKKKQILTNQLYFFKFFKFKYKKPLNYNNIIYFDIRFKNTRISLLRKDGSPIITYTTGHVNAKKHERKSFHAAKKLIIKFLKTKEIRNIGKFYLYIKGFCRRRQFFFKKISKIKRFKRKCIAIVDITTLPFNGCRGRKYRRI